MEIIVNHRQFIHCKVSNSEGVLSWFTVIYASPHPSIKSSLWMEIDVLTATIRGPWLLVRDFNAICFSSEKKGSARVSGVYRLFNKCCFRNNICELTYKGPNFT